MAREIPEVVRAAAGLAATVLDEARKLPETLPGLPVRAIGLAMQQAMRVQQHYAGFVARGDELFTGLRGEDEPGLATFDEDLDAPADADAAAPTGGYRESAFDRADLPLSDGTDDVRVDDAPAAEKPARKKAAKTVKAPAAGKPADKAPRSPRKTAISDVEVSSLPDDPEADAVVAAVEDVADQVEGAQQTLDTLPGEAPSTEEVLEELAIDDMVGDAPVTGAAATPAGDDAGATDTTSDSATDEGGTPVAAAPAGEPVEGYDSLSIAQLRGRLRGYALSTVADLLAYEEATRSREPYLRMLRNRLERLEAQAVESSPLAPRGA